MLSSSSSILKAVTSPPREAGRRSSRLCAWPLIIAWPEGNGAYADFKKGAAAVYGRYVGDSSEANAQCVQLIVLPPRLPVSSSSFEWQEQQGRGGWFVRKALHHIPDLPHWQRLRDLPIQRGKKVLNSLYKSQNCRFL
jgi:hypothetical protein